MGAQEYINIIVGLVGAGGGWWIKNMWDIVHDLQKTDEQHAKELAEVRILVAGKYVHKNEHETIMTRIFQKLDVIEGKLTDNALRAAEIAAMVEAHDMRTQRDR